MSILKEAHDIHQKAIRGITHSPVEMSQSEAVIKAIDLRFTAIERRLKLLERQAGRIEA